MNDVAARRNWKRFIWPVAATVAFAAIIVAYLLQSPAKAILRAGDASYTLTIASTPALREQGLSGRKTMAADRGMLFVFAKPQRVCMWMKDMQFPIDMIWLDEDKKVLYVRERVSPDTYPESFCSDEPAKYVIELKAGEAARRHITPGQELAL